MSVVGWRVGDVWMSGVNHHCGRENGIFLSQLRHKRTIDACTTSRTS